MALAPVHLPSAASAGLPHAEGIWAMCLVQWGEAGAPGVRVGNAPLGHTFTAEPRVRRVCHKGELCVREGGGAVPLPRALAKALIGRVCAAAARFVAARTCL